MTREQRVPDRLAGRDRRDPHAAGAADPFDPHDIVGSGRGEPAQHLEPAEREASGALGVVVAGAVELRARGREPFAGRDERARNLFVAGDVDRALARVDDRGQAPSRVIECVHRGPVGAGARQHAAHAADGIGRDVACKRARGVVGEGVRFVDDHDVVLRQHATLRCKVRAVQRVVHDEHGHLVRAIARPLGEALGPVGALGSARALDARATDGGPRGRVDLVFELGPIAGVGPFGELPQAGLLAAEVGSDRHFEQRIRRLRGPQLGAAQVVRAAFE